MATDESRQFLEQMRQMELRQIAGAIQANSQANLLRRHTYDPGAYVRNDAWMGATPLYSTLHHPLKPFESALAGRRTPGSIKSEAMSGSGNPGSLWNVEGRKYADQLMRQRAAELEGIRNPDIPPSTVAEAAAPLPLPSDLPPAIQKQKEEFVQAFQMLSDEMERSNLNPLEMEDASKLLGLVNTISRTLPQVLLISSEDDITEIIQFNSQIMSDLMAHINTVDERFALGTAVPGEVVNIQAWSAFHRQIYEKLKTVNLVMADYVSAADASDKERKLRLKAAMKEHKLGAIKRTTVPKAGPKFEPTALPQEEEVDRREEAAARTAAARAARQQREMRQMVAAETGDEAAAARDVLRENLRRTRRARQ